MAEVVRIQVQAETKSAEDALRRAQQLADKIGSKKTTLRIEAEGLDGVARQIDVVSRATSKLVVAQDTFNALSRGVISVNQAMEDMGGRVNRVNTDLQSFIDKSTGVSRETSQITAKTSMFGKVSDETFASYTSGAMSGAAATATLDKNVNNLGNSASKTGNAFSGLISKFSAANLISAAVTRAISLLRQALRQAVDEMKEMDKELTTIKMVAGSSSDEIKQLTQDAFAGARETGRNVTEYLSAAERFTRAGYRDNIDQLSKLSLITQNIGGVEEDTAAKFLLAADAAWKLNGSYDALMGVLDGVSSVADQNATDLGKIAEGITVAGSAFANAGESAQTFTAMLGVTTASTQRSGSEMARGLRTILFRVRQVKAEFEDGEIVNEKAISNAANALRDIAHIDVFDKQTHDLKSLSQILSELAPKWKTLSDAEQSALQNYLAGNKQGNVLYALMDNWGEYEKMLQQYEESSGTALEKNAEYTSSWAAETEKLKSAWTETVSLITDSGELQKGFARDFSKLLTDINAAWKNAAEMDAYKRDVGHWEWDDYGAYIYVLDKANVTFEEWKAEQEAAKKALEEEAKAADDTGKSLDKYTDDANKAGKASSDAADEVDELATAFEQANDRIKKASDGMKTDRDDAVKSIADVYKAMTNAADKKYYGSNAYREGAKLFFGTTSKDAIKEDARKALDAYFSEIEKGNYSRAAANLWGKIFNGNGKDGAKDILDKNGKIIASMKDLGGAFEWTFNRGDQSISEFLQSMETATGIGADFWASFIQSLGMYSDELDSWFEEKEIKTKVTVDTAEASNEIDGHIEHLGSIPGEVNTTVTTTYVTNGSPPSYPNGEGSSGDTTFSGGGSGRHFAKGKRDKFSGIAMVNDEFPADGSKPELIISKSTGRAFIANGGKPALVNLRSDDIVLTAKETRSALSVPTFDGGKYAGAATAKAAVLADETFGGGGSDDSVTTPDDPNDGPGGGKKKDKEKEAQEAWETLKKLIGYLMDKAEGELHDMLEALDQQLEALEAERKEQKQQKELEEKQLAVQQALVDLEKAQTERTVRYYNEETQQWEWMADQGEVEKAREALKNAEEDLKEYQDDLEYEAKRDAINQQKQDLQAQFDAYKENWEDIIDIIEAPIGDIQELLETIFGNASGTLLGEAQSIADLLNTLNAGFLSSGYELGLGRINDNTENSTTTIDTIFGHQSAANTEDLLASIIGSVFGSGNMNDILGPTSKGGFAFNTEGLKAVTGGIENSLTYRNPSSTINNNGGNYYVNGVKIGADMAQKPFAEVMRTIAIHANETA